MWVCGEDQQEICLGFLSLRDSFSLVVVPLLYFLSLYQGYKFMLGAHMYSNDCNLKEQTSIIGSPKDSV